MSKPKATREWRVVVHTAGVGDIGSVVETDEELARCAALSKFGVRAESEAEEERGQSTQRLIFLDDEFDVRPA